MRCIFIITVCSFMCVFVLYDDRQRLIRYFWYYGTYKWDLAFHFLTITKITILNQISLSFYTVMLNWNLKFNPLNYILCLCIHEVCILDVYREVEVRIYRTIIFWWWCTVHSYSLLWCMLHTYNIITILISQNIWRQAMT